MGEAATYVTEREADLERRREKAQRDRTRREQRAAKRSRFVASDLRSLDALLDGAGNLAVGAKSGSGPATAESTVGRAHGPAPEATMAPAAPVGTAAAARDVSSLSGGAKADPSTTSRPTFAERRQLLADRARNSATSSVAEEARRGGERRSAEREMARRSLRTLSLDPRYAEARRRIELAIAADDPAAVRAAARRALWSAAGDAALRPGAECEAELSVCTALAVIEWLPISAIRAGRKARSAVGVPAAGADAAFRARAMARQVPNGGGEEMEQRQRSAAGAFVVRLHDRCEPRLTGGYQGCELELPVVSLKLAQTLDGALLERDHTDELAAGTYCKPLAGGTRTVTLEPVG